jgi:RimJ/RimL family protein N-acetyltransferase
MNDALTTREMTAADVPAIARYWLGSDAAHLEGMGVDLAKLPREESLTAGLYEQLSLPVAERHAYCLVWVVDGVAVGHCNTNPTVYGREAWMHLHLWSREHRRRGLGVALLRITLPRLFEALALERLYSEPYAHNPAPHRALERVGFELVKEYVTVPGAINFEQPVKQWCMTRARLAEVRG